MSDDQAMPLKEIVDDAPARDGMHATAVSKQRPRGLWLLLFLMVLAGLFLLAQPIPVYLELQRDENLSLSYAYKLNLVSEGLLALTAIVGSIALFCGAKWGWLLTALYFPWDIVRQIQISMRPSFEVEPEGGGLEAGHIRIVVLGIITAYLFRRRVLEFVGLTTLHRAWAAVGIVLGGAAIGWMLDPLNGLLAAPADFGE